MNALETASRIRIEGIVFDRLVDGELDEAARGALLRRLDHEPDGWKRCALAFIEAQAWREAMSTERGSGMASPWDVGARRSHRLAALRQIVAVAAAVTVAFGVGFMSRGIRADRGGAPDAGRVLVQGPGATHGEQTASARTATATVPEYLRRQMERQGYRIDGDRKIVPVALDDGRKIAVPVETVSLRYVGQRIH